MYNGDLTVVGSYRILRGCADCVQQQGLQTKNAAIRAVSNVILEDLHASRLTLDNGAAV